MKMTKKILTAAFIFILGASAFAQSNSYGINFATADTVLENDTYFLNVTDWDKINFSKLFATTDFTLTSRGKLGVATHLGKGDLHAAWLGNLWDADSYNQFNFLYGIGKLGIMAGFTATKYGGTYGNHLPTYIPSLSCGYQISDAFDVDGTFTGEFGSQSAAGTTQSYKDFYIRLGGKYYIKESETVTAFTSLYYSGFYSNSTIKTSGTDAVVTEDSYHYVIPGFLLNIKPTSSFTYGLKASSSLRFDENSAALYFSISNGFSAQVTKMLLVNAGLTTTIPSITFTKNQDPETGNFYNYFYGGFSIYLIPEVRLDLSAYIYPADGVSLNEIWNQNFYIGIEACF